MQHVKSVFYGCLLISFLLPFSSDADETEIPSSERLAAFFEEAFQSQLDRSPMFKTALGMKEDYGKWDDPSDQNAAAELAMDVALLGRLQTEFDVHSLEGQDRLSYRLFERRIEKAIEGYRWRFHSYPVNQMFGAQSELASFLINYHRIETRQDARDYISRLHGFFAYFEAVVEGLYARAEKGILPPDFVFPLVLNDCRNLISGAPFEESEEASTLLADFAKKIAAVENLAEADRQTMLAEAKHALLKSVLPAYHKLIRALEDLETQATNEAGVWKFPQGGEYYMHRLRSVTTTEMSASGIHDLGLREMDRIHDEMRAIMRAVEYDGDLQAFFEFMRDDERFYYPNDEEGRSRYLKEATAIVDDFREDLDRMFGIKPKAEMVVKRVEPFREKSAGKAFYSVGAPDGSRPGVYYANLYRMDEMPTYQMEALAFHEGIPGHHMQLSIAQELQGIPKFRRFGGYTAYVEGWGLYCELLPKEYGYYKDPYSDFGRLAMELWRAARLVVDTGLHYHRWSRQKAIDYLKKNTPNPEGDCIKAIDRYIVMPGQATAYKIGMIRILDLREKAKKALGAKFDIRGFHDVVLENGAVPLSLLEELVDDWVLAVSSKD